MNKLVKKLTKAISSQKAEPSRRSRRRRARRSGRSRRGRASGMPSLSHLPLAFTTNPRSYFSTVTGKDSVRVRGMDLVYDPSIDSNETTVITANPAYWKGTRIAALAAAYQSYRPLRLKFHWVPVVPVTKQGIVYYGTLWNAKVNTALPQTLVTSNGGGMCQVYMPTSTVVALGSSLTQNLYFMSGDLGQDTNPFMFVATVGQKSTQSTESFTGMGGYWYVEYEFDLKNALGSSISYTSGYGPISNPTPIKEYTHVNYVGAVSKFANLAVDLVSTTAGKALFNILDQGSRWVTDLFSGGRASGGTEDYSWYFANSDRDESLIGELTYYEPGASSALTSEA